MSSKTFETTIVRAVRCALSLSPSNPNRFGRVRAPVTVAVNGYTDRSTIASMGGSFGIPLRRSHREAAGLEGGESVVVRVDLDTTARAVEPPADLREALESAPPAWERWQERSYSHQRETVDAIEEARKAETRLRRIASATQRIAELPPRKRR